MTRYRALLGCTAISVMVALGFPSVTALAADDTEPTAPSAEPLAEGSETTVPETTVPETTVPETTVPETTVPETTVPETTVPETTVPDGTDVATGGAVATATAATVSSATEAPTETTAIRAEASSLALTAVMPQVHGVLATMRVVDTGSTKYPAVTISWLGVPGDDRYGMDFYQVERQHSTSTTWDLVNHVTGDGELSVEDTYFTRDSWGTYQYRVTPMVYDNSVGYVRGVPGYASVDVTRVGYPPSMPRSVQAAAGFGAVTVTWTAPPTDDDDWCDGNYSFCDEATSYTLSWAPVGGTWQSVTTNSTSRIISGLRGGVAHYFTVRAENSSGSSASTSWVSAKPMAPTPTAPRQPTATPSVGRVKLTWFGPAAQGASAVTRQVIQRSQNKVNWVNVTTTLAPAARSYTVTGLPNGVRYYYRIASVNAHGQGPWSTVVTAVTPTRPTAPRSLIVYPGPRSATLNWASPASNGGVPITDFIIQRSTDGRTWTTMYDGVSTSRRWTQNWLTNGRRYYYRVAARNAIGIGPYSAPVGVTPRTVPGAVTGLRATRLTNGVKLSWNAPSTGGSPILYYREQVWLPDGWFDGVTTTRRDLTINSGIGGGYYDCDYFRIAAVNAAGTGPWSNPIRACGPPPYWV